MFRPNASGLFYAGIALLLGGFALVALTWLQTSTRGSVAFQVPYLVSGGLTGLGLIVLGALAINVQVKRQESAVRQQQMERLTAIMLAVAEHVAPGATAPTDATPEQGPE